MERFLAFPAFRPFSTLVLLYSPPHSVSARQCLCRQIRFSKIRQFSLFVGLGQPARPLFSISRQPFATATHSFCFLSNFVLPLGYRASPARGRIFIKFLHLVRVLTSSYRGHVRLILALCWTRCPGPKWIRRQRYGVLSFVLLLSFCFVVRRCTVEVCLHHIRWKTARCSLQF